MERVMTSNENLLYILDVYQLTEIAQCLQRALTNINR